MSIDLRMPNITGNEREQLAQIRSYLYQFIPQLQFALNTLAPTAPSNNLVNKPTKSDESTSKSESTELTFAKLKPLIIKSADIVQAYYDEINRRLSGVYVAESDFGTFFQQTEQTIKETSEGIERNFNNIQGILTDIENLNYSLADINACIKTGEIDQDSEGLPIYGIEIMQRTSTNGEEKFKKMARFAANRISFYDQYESPIAYLSDYKLHITNAEILETLKLGGFLIDSTKGLRVKWEGRG